MTEADWDARYAGRSAVWSGRPNAVLLDELDALGATADGPAPGTALDAGCGEGADALELARRGWRVLAVDHSGVALERAAANARATDPEASARITWVKADLVAGLPHGTAGAMDLVSVQFLHLPPDPRVRAFAGLAAAVAPGGALLLVGHSPRDLLTTAHRPPRPEVFWTAEELARDFGADEWEVQVAEARPRDGVGRDGEPIVLHDEVLRARRRP